MKKLFLTSTLFLSLLVKGQNYTYNSFTVEDKATERIDKTSHCNTMGSLFMSTDSISVNGKGWRIKQTGTNTFKGNGYTISLLRKEGKIERVYIRKHGRVTIFYLDSKES